MYGREYLDWHDKTRVAGEIDTFLADMDPEDRKWALAVLRERHTVYRDNPLSPGRPLMSLLQQQIEMLEMQRLAARPAGILGAVGNVFGV